MKKSIGVRLEPPKETCNDSHCAWHGQLAVRGKVFSGVVKSDKTKNTSVVEWKYHKKIQKYDRYERRKSRVTAHKPDCMKAKEGDRVVIAECRPLSKTKHFVVVAVVKE
ncbi:MAG: 30S ribosomal protein S17 [Nanoarchaeota archaeon]